MFVKSWLMITAAFAAVGWATAAPVAKQLRPRLSETDLDLELMGKKLPVDPDGSDGPKRVAGYFALNRTEVRAGQQPFTQLL